jgi:hypothetical protein
MIVKDSSIWRDFSSVANEIRGNVRVGIVLDRGEDEKLGTTMYLVEVLAEGKRYTLMCTQMVKFGSPYNYEQYSYTKVESLGIDLLPDMTPDFGVRSGDTVVVAELSGNEGIILGALKHPARSSPVAADEIAYESRYNGLTTQILKDGSYKVTFNGEPLPTVTAQLKLPFMTKALPDAAAYNPLTAGSYFTFEKDGSYEVSDGSKVLPQGIKIDKTGGTTTITSGLVTIAIDKKTQKVDVSCIDASISAKKSVKIDTTQLEMQGLAGVKIKGAKIAIGFGGVELIDSIIQLIDAIGLLVIPHHLGPCSPVSASPTWAQIIALKTQLTLIKGSL